MAERKRYSIKGIPNDILTSDVINDRKLKTDGTPKDYFIEVAQGNVIGSSFTSIVAKNRNVGVAYEDISGFGGVMVFPSSPEVYEISSSDVNDIDGGTGLRTVLVVSLDANFIEQSQIVTMNGVNAVTLTGTHIRPRLIQGLTAGSNGVNLGTITLQVAGGGDVRNIILPDEGASYDGHFTVPAGKKAYILQSFTSYGKDDSGETRARIKLDGLDSCWVSIAPIPGYQNLIEFNVEAIISLPEKTDVQMQGRSNTATADITAIFELQLIDE